MSENVILPKWGLTMEDGAVAAWHVSEGDSVVEGEVIADVETEKVETELEAPCGGIIARILVPENDTVDVGTVLAIIAGDSAEAVRIREG
ncbi:MAG: biotin/lipoyl-containing protein [Acidimicrobiales bacterium]|jgi:pyruvate/2-oxoglutarate dehydrogenase complex dihydrolipoamide acyltransferase (E2) component|nr:biotin attachment protein [Acidimicrobiaceae bacterium]MDP6076775.1 biotin/lipoyl-containing protein [Acidimicrobiales bacterium]MDP7259033.1 biotin/lipoyl-containing protein [Acidimicrobiales bacterium]HCV36528.1 biotin attachment protein [Acidimicrobiaceae bacterium]HJO80421.1 biotin/lipoyl-containing protein [Acidimicrobiales bacterium]|tara:strand:+ start:3847 stop:4116 length:270 start_codon:yes stop_codon:yes gene_type:complete